MRIHLAAWIGCLCVLLAPAASKGSEDEGTSASPRQLYNDGTKRLKEGKLAEAEACLQAAVTSQIERVQGPSLFNLGEVRFKQGAEELKKTPDPKAVNEGSKHASEGAMGAISAADQALASEDLQAMIEAYQRGRGARKDLKGAMTAVKVAMDKYGFVLSKWQRSSGDFKSDYELFPSDREAKANADVMDQNIARLIDQQQVMMQSMKGMGKQRSELKKKMDQLRQKMPKDQGDQMKSGDDDDDDDDDNGKKKEPKDGMEQPNPKIGKEMALTREEAARLLDMLKLDANRKLPLGTNGTGKPEDRKGKDW